MQADQPTAHTFGALPMKTKIPHILTPRSTTASCDRSRSATNSCRHLRSQFPVVAAGSECCSIRIALKHGA